MRPMMTRPGPTHQQFAHEGARGWSAQPPQSDRGACAADPSLAGDAENRPNCMDCMTGRTYGSVHLSARTPRNHRTTAPSRTCGDMPSSSFVLTFTWWVLHGG
jgi:hypothetical protein